MAEQKAKPEVKKENQPAKKEGAAVILASGERRIDYIRRRYKEGAKRGEIAKELGVPYQIVFAATKKKPAEQPQAQAQAAK